MSLDSIISVEITSATRQPSRKGFGRPLIVGAHTNFPERVRLYTDEDDMLVDGFLTTDKEFLAVRSVFAQENSPPDVKVAKRLGIPTQTIRITPISTVEDLEYTGTIGGQTWLYKVLNGDSIADIVAGIDTAIDALSTAVTSDATSTTFCDVSEDVPGTWFPYTFGNLSADLEVDDITAEPGIDLATDLAAIYDEDPDWYGLIVADAQSHDQITAIAAFAESKEILYIAHTMDTDVAKTGSADVVSTLVASSFARTTPFYSRAGHGDFPGAALFGRVLPKDPGSIDWVYKTLAGVAVDSLTANELAQLTNKFATHYHVLNEVNVTRVTKVAANEFTDVVRGRDWLKARIQERIFTLLINSEKVPFTDNGISLTLGEIEAQLDEGIVNNVLAADPVPTTTAPRAADVPVADKAARNLPGVEFQATLAGSIRTLEIIGRLAV